MRIGVVALQGAVPEHIRTLQYLGVQAVPVKFPEHIAGLAGLVLPGGESTTIGDLMQHFGLMQAIRDWGGPCYGTCAGAILLAQEILDGKPDQPRLGLIPMAVRRNGFGRQVASMEVPITMPVLGPEPVRAVLIRAPYMESVGTGVDVLAQHQGKTVAVRYGHHLATAFHPELTEDMRIHRFFVEEICSTNKATH